MYTNYPIPQSQESCIYFTESPQFSDRTKRNGKETRNGSLGLNYLEEHNMRETHSISENRDSLGPNDLGQNHDGNVSLSVKNHLPGWLKGRNFRPLFCFVLILCSILFIGVLVVINTHSYSETNETSTIKYTGNFYLCLCILTIHQLKLADLCH